MQSSHSLSRVVADYIRDQIELHLLVPGEFISLDAIEDALGVSRTPIREAIRQLELENLVEIAPGKGARVSKIEEHEIDQLYDYRLHLEAACTRQAAEQISDFDIRILEENLAAYETCIGRSSQLSVLDRQFHYIIYGCIQNPYLERSLKSVRIKMGLMSAPAYANSARSKQTLSEHRAIVRAFRSRDVEKAERAAQRHIKKAWSQRSR